jgi:Zn-dependent M28 family amino/carboxypeptidase
MSGAHLDSVEEGPGDQRQRLRTPFDGRSDHGPFIENGVPAGGLFTGAEDVKTAQEAATYGGTAGEAYDSCYQQACDDRHNPSLTALEQMSDACGLRALSQHQGDQRPGVGSRHDAPGGQG